MKDQFIEGLRRAADARSDEPVLTGETLRADMENMLRETSEAFFTLYPEEDPPPFMFFAGRNQCAVVPIPVVALQSEGGKDALATLIRDTLATLPGLLHFGMVTACWFLHTTEADRVAPGTSLADVEGRKEGLMITYESRAGERHLSRIEVFREDVVRLGETVTLPTHDRLEGRFVNFFEPVKESPHGAH